MKILHSLFLLTTLSGLFSSCGTHLVLTHVGCRPEDVLSFYKAEGRWYTSDMKKRATGAQSFHYEEKAHSFWGKTLSPVQEISLCEMVHHQRGKNIDIETYFSLRDLLWGIVPGYSPRTIVLKGEYDLLEEKDANP